LTGFFFDQLRLRNLKIAQRTRRENQMLTAITPKITGPSS